MDFLRLSRTIARSGISQEAASILGRRQKWRPGVNWPRRLGLRRIGSIPQAVYVVSGMVKETEFMFFEVRLERLPQLQLDNREIGDARLASVSDLALLR
jgi:hypothetical protein